MILPQKILKFGCSETLLLCAERATSFYICKLIVIIVPIFICVFSHTNTRFCFIFQAVYLRFWGIRFS